MNNVDTNLTLETFPNGIVLYQSENFYKFTKDAIDLAKFCSIKHTDNVLELCAGSGVVSFYAYSLKPFNKMYLNELQPGLCEIIKKNIELNKLQNKAVCLEGDLANLADKDFDKKLDVIICNPPYFKSEKKINLEYSKAVARHEIATNLST
ncbi:MAG: RsmD family RNA methyltransferase, partial [Clostridia bacterium]|nr:RsmD family RNA methyltransferase [Clostridia bacterium]